MSSEDLPFVSCICVTRDRPRELARAVADYEAQTYPEELRELVIVADGGTPDYDGAHWLGSSRVEIGAKRNIAVSRAVGDVIVHWDDDDQYHPERIEHQVHRLLASDARIVGYNTMRFRVRETGEVWEYCGSPGYAVGVSLCYWRDAWEAKPFNPNRMVGEDNEFQTGRQVDTCDSEDMIIATIHRGNTNATASTLGQDPWRRIG